MRWLAEICDGDARIALGALELVLNAGPTGTTTANRKLISLEDLKRGIKVINKLKYSLVSFLLLCIVLKLVKKENKEDR